MTAHLLRRAAQVGMAPLEAAAGPLGPSGSGSSPAASAATAVRPPVIDQLAFDKLPEQSMIQRRTVSRLGDMHRIQTHMAADLT